MFSTIRIFFFLLINYIDIITVRLIGTPHIKIIFLTITYTARASHGPKANNMYKCDTLVKRRASRLLPATRLFFFFCQTARYPGALPLTRSGFGA